MSRILIKKINLKHPKIQISNKINKIFLLYHIYPGKNETFVWRLHERLWKFVESLKTISKEFVEQKLQHCSV